MNDVGMELCPKTIIENLWLQFAGIYLPYVRVFSSGKIEETIPANNILDTHPQRDYCYLVNNIIARPNSPLSIAIRIFLFALIIIPTLGLACLHPIIRNLIFYPYLLQGNGTNNQNDILPWSWAGQDPSIYDINFVTQLEDGLKDAMGLSRPLVTTDIDQEPPADIAAQNDNVPLGKIIDAIKSGEQAVTEQLIISSIGVQLLLYLTGTAEYAVDDIVCDKDLAASIRELKPELIDLSPKKEWYLNLSFKNDGKAPYCGGRVIDTIIEDEGAISSHMQNFTAYDDYKHERDVAGNLELVNLMENTVTRYAIACVCTDITEAIPLVDLIKKENMVNAFLESSDKQKWIKKVRSQTKCQGAKCT
jgi:hypothetical protein